jgi:CBS domain-containing protein
MQRIEMLTTVEVILQTKGSTVWSVTPETTVFDAIALMAEKNVGALLVMDRGRLAGIVSERDYSRKVALLGKNSRTTAVCDILTEAVHRVTPETSIQQCMELMSDKRVRHLPVMVGDELVGIVSIGDLVNWTIRTQKAAIDQLQAYIAGGYPA